MSFEIEDTRTITVNWCMAKLTGINQTINPTYNVTINNLQFPSPDFIKLELFSVMIPFLNLNDRLFVVQSNITGTDPILSFTGQQNFPVNMSSVIRISKPVSSMNFQVQMLNDANQLVDPVLAGTCYISITMTLLRIKKYHNDIIRMPN